MSDRIEVNPKIMAGKPVIKGTRIPVYLILDLLAEGRTVSDVIKAYPDIKEEDVRAALHYAGHLTRYEEQELIDA